MIVQTAFITMFFCLAPQGDFTNIALQEERQCVKIEADQLDISTLEECSDVAEDLGKQFIEKHPNSTLVHTFCTIY